MKLLVSLNNKVLDDYLDYTNSFIIGLKDFSVNYLEFDILEISDLLNKYPNIELFVSINKNIFNSEIEKLEENIIKLSKLNIKGILFYDLSILQINKSKGLKLPLVWHQTHMVTNYNTCNYYYNDNVNFSYLSSEICEDDIIEISNNTKQELMVLLIGHPIVSHSKRKLLSNYFEYKKIKKDKNIYKISSNNSNDYFIEETKNGTSIIYGNIVNGIRNFFNLKDIISYGILDEKLIDHDKFINVLKIMSNAIKNDSNKEDIIKEVTEILESDDTNFFYKRTIYKVKDEKKS